MFRNFLPGAPWSQATRARLQSGKYIVTGSLSHHRIPILTGSILCHSIPIAIVTTMPPFTSPRFSLTETQDVVGFCVDWWVPSILEVGSLAAILTIPIGNDTRTRKARPATQIIVTMVTRTVSMEGTGCLVCSRSWSPLKNAPVPPRGRKGGTSCHSSVCTTGCLGAWRRKFFGLQPTRPGRPGWRSRGNILGSRPVQSPSGSSSWERALLFFGDGV